LGGVEVATGRNPGYGAAGATPITRIADPGRRITYYALMLFPAYGGMTLALWIGLLLAGETGLVALCHAMATLSTSGVSPVGGIAGTGSGWLGEVLIALFLIAALSRRPLLVLSGVEGRIWAYDAELRTAAVILFVVVVSMFAVQAFGTAEAMNATAALQIIWGAFFTGLSYLTTTGFVSAGWTGTQAWSGLQTPGLILLSLALLGGGVATTAGGVKLLRVYALFRHGQHELERLIEPSSVGGRGQDARQMRGEGAYLAWVFFVLFAMSIGAVTALLTLCSMQIEPAIVFALAALTNTGPLTAIAMPIPADWADLGKAPQAILAAAMVLGRLETLAVLAFLAPDSWRR
ncbi:MAG: potassium transporter TrkG, partial [Paracoccaceae bacterium]